MASSAPQEPTKSIQVGLENTRINYYDIMVIGNTGQGKSTTSDKIIIANPSGKKYTLDVPVSGQANQQGMTVDEQNQQVKYTDISMWLAHGSEKNEFESHLKFLHYCRTKDKPHEEINRVRSALASGANEVFKPTTECEVLSNESSRIRIMDVPGFFDGASVLAKQQEEKPEGTDLMSPLDMNNLDIMRKIIRIQTALSMKFNRILYFLPCRGPLERANAHLKLELKWMAHFFDRAIFKSMVLVATVPARFSKMDMTDDDKFPQEDVKMTKDLFRQALKEVFNNPAPNNPLPDPPLIFISLTDTCEQILAKIKAATVQQEGLHLQIDPSTCAECGVKIGVVKDQRVTCYFGEDPANAIPYEESTCHPFFVPKYSRIDKIWGGFKYIVSLGWVSGDPWPVFIGEKCAACGGVANMRGCMKVGSDYGKGSRKITVDHTNQVVDAVVPDEQADEGIDNSAGAVNTLPATGSGPDASQSQSDGHGQNGVNQVASQDIESSVTLLEGGIANMRLHMEHPPNQPYMVERSADNPAFTGESGT